MKVMIHQPEFLPWINLFLKIKYSNKFIFLDDIQYNRRSFQNRNLIKTNHGSKYLTVPVLKCSRDTMIKSIRIDQSKEWINDHLKLIKHNYSKSQYFFEVIDFIEKIYTRKKWIYLIDLNIFLIKEITKKLKLNILFDVSSNYKSKKKKSDLILDLCLKANVSEYVTGTGSIDYLKKEDFKKKNILLKFIKPNFFFYKQTFPGTEFLNDLSILDYLFNCGFENFPNCQIK